MKSLITSGVLFYAGAMEGKVSWFVLFAINFIQSVYVWSWLSYVLIVYITDLEVIMWTGLP